MKGQVVLISRLAARDLRRRPVEALMVFLVIAAAATTLTVAFALSGVTNKPYQQTRLATARPGCHRYRGWRPRVSSAGELRATGGGRRLAGQGIRCDRPQRAVPNGL
jgi:hypothetical protein